MNPKVSYKPDYFFDLWRLFKIEINDKKEACETSSLIPTPHLVDLSSKTTSM